MRILLVTQYFWPEEFRINDLAVGLIERGHDVVVLTGIPNYPSGESYSGYGLFRPLRQEHSGVQIIRVPLVPRGKAKKFRLAVNYISYFISASVFGPFLCHGHYDLIFVYEPSPVTVGVPAIVLKCLKRVPILFWVQDLWPESLSATGAIRSKWLLAKVRSLVRFIYKYCDRILVQSPAFFPMVIANGVNRERIEYFPNSVEPVYKLFCPPERTEGTDTLPVGFRVMFAGNIGAAQAFGTILAAASLLQNIKEIQWIILGDGRARAWVEAQVAELGLASCVHLLGRHPVRAMPCFFARADVMLVTLKKDPIFSWTIPAKVQSYMACARPIVAAVDGEGGRLVRESGCGIDCPAEDADALAEAVLAMFKKPKDERELMGEKGREYCDLHFNRERLMDRLEVLMSEVTQKEVMPRAKDI